MNLLLDTHILLWAVDDSPNLSVPMRKLIGDPGRRVFVSMASLWEVAIKQSLGKLNLLGDLHEAVEENYELLNIGVHHLRQLRDLPLLHRDPFDRMLVAQALAEGLTLLTHDRRICAYDARAVLAGAED